MKKLTLAALAPALMLTACGGGDPEETIAAIRHNETAQLQSIESGDLVGVARLYADEAVMIRPDGTTLMGGAEIANAYGDLLEDPNFALVSEPVDGWASTGDDLAVVTSNVDFTTSDPETGEAVTMPMISQTVWERAPGASWKIVSTYNVARAGEAAPAGADPEVEAAD